MRVLNVNHILDPVAGGGTAERTVQISSHLVKAGAKCTVLTLDIGLTSDCMERLAGVEVVALPCLNHRFFVPRFSRQELTRLIGSVDIVHLMGHWTLLNAIVYLFCRKQNKPYVICTAGALPLFGRSQLLKRIYNRVIGESIVKNAERFVAITRDELEYYKGYGGESSRALIIANGISPDDYLENDIESFRDQYRLPQAPIFLFLGRLNTIKGPDLLLEAFIDGLQSFPAYHLVFAGPDDGMLEILSKRVKSAGLEERVHFIGFIGGVDKSRTLWASDLLIVPSRQEAMSIVALEAGITGTPVLLTDQCGFDEVARIGGGLVVPASVFGLKEGLVDISHNRDRLQKMGESLREYVLANYTWNIAVEKYLDLFERIVAVEQ